MEQVIWFFADENEDILAQIIMGIDEKEQAIDDLSSKVLHGRYNLGYIHADGTKTIFRNSRQIV